MMTKYMTTKEVAAEMEVSPATVVRWVRDGLIPAKRFGQRIIKIPRLEIEQMLKQKCAVEVKVS
jgi:excisionase family DNA binding protein